VGKDVKKTGEWANSRKKKVELKPALQGWGREGAHTTRGAVKKMGGGGRGKRMVFWGRDSK